jgi:hypothetical protein
VLNVSGSQLVLLLVFAVAQAVLGYFLAEADRRNLGRTPWGLPSVVWAVIWFLSLLLALILWFVAHRAEVRRAAQAPYVPMGGVVPTPQPAQASASDFPAYPRRADGGSREVPPPGGPAGGAGTGAPAGGPGAGATGAAAGHGAAPGHEISPPAWHPDPSGRFHYRWWTGSEWTSFVSVHGHVEVDNHPDQRIGPYS